MHRHITYYTQSTLCKGRFSNKFLGSSSWAYAGFANGGGGATIFFWVGGLRGVDMRLLGGFRSMLARNFFFEWCNLVRFGAYYHKIFTFKQSKNIIFIQK